MDTFGRVIPQLSELDKEILLAFGEGAALMAGQMRAAPERAQDSA